MEDVYDYIWSSMFVLCLHYPEHQIHFNVANNPLDLTWPTCLLFTHNQNCLPAIKMATVAVATTTHAWEMESTFDSATIPGIGRPLGEKDLVLGSTTRVSTLPIS